MLGLGARLACICTEFGGFVATCADKFAPPDRKSPKNPPCSTSITRLRAILGKPVETQHRKRRNVPKCLKMRLVPVGCGSPRSVSLMRLCTVPVGGENLVRLSASCGPRQKNTAARAAEAQHALSELALAVLQSIRQRTGSITHSKDLAEFVLQKR